MEPGSGGGGTGGETEPAYTFRASGGLDSDG